MADEKKPRQILDVEVKEVSLVDHAANLRRFLIIKRRNEEDDMPNFEPDDKVEKAATPNPDEEAAKKAAAEKEAKDKAAKPDEEMPEEKKTDKAANPKMVAGLLRGMTGLPKKEADAVIAALEAKKAEGGEEDEYPKPESKRTKKSVDGEPPMLVIGSDGSITINEGITKRRQFTNERTKTIADAAMGMMKLLKEVDEEACKSIMSTIKELPSNATVPQAVKPTGEGSPVKKSDEVAALQDELKKRDDKIEALEKRLDEIAKVRTPSQSVDDLGGTDKEPVEKKKSLFSGVI